MLRLLTQCLSIRCLRSSRFACPDLTIEFLHKFSARKMATRVAACQMRSNENKQSNFEICRELVLKAVDAGAKVIQKMLEFNLFGVCALQ